MNPPNNPTIARVERIRSFARLFLCEPDAQDLRVEFTRLLTLNVFPYASVYLDAEPCLNSETSARIQLSYDQAGFGPDPRWPIGAPDHFGVELEFVAHLMEAGQEPQADEFLTSEILLWTGIFTHAVEMNAHAEFFRALARDARAWLMGQAKTANWNLPPAPVAEDDLDAVVRMLITPSRSGFFLSKLDIARMARGLDLPVPFGDRGLMLQGLFHAAGEYKRIKNLLDALGAETHAWIESYETDERAYPAAAGIAQGWRGRAERTLGRLHEMKQTVQQYE